MPSKNCWQETYWFFINDRRLVCQFSNKFTDRWNQKMRCIFYFFKKSHTYLQSDHIKKKFVWLFFQKHSRFKEQQGKVEGFSLTPLNLFHPLHWHLDDSQAITAKSSPLHIVSSRTWTKNLFPCVSRWPLNCTPLIHYNIDGRNTHHNVGHKKTNMMSCAVKIVSFLEVL